MRHVGHLFAFFEHPGHPRLEQVGDQGAVVEEKAGQAPESAVATALTAVEVPEDFRGSAEYRRAMAPVLARRALAQAQSTSVFS